MKLHPLSLAAAFVVAASLNLHAAKLGDPAAPLAIKEWVQGKAVDVKDGKNIYVVEFWATWCPPCRESIPHLTAMQKKFKDKGVVFVGVTQEEPDAVKPFVAKMAGQMDYAVAIDKGGATHDAYLRPYNVNGIPHAFVVDQHGAIVWHGHPMDRMDQVLARMTGDASKPALPPPPVPAGKPAPAPAPSAAAPAAPPAPPPPPEKLALKGIVGSGARALASISGQSLGAGEEVKIKLNGKTVKVRCVEIQKDAVIVSVDGGPSETLRMTVK